MLDYSDYGCPPTVDGSPIGGGNGYLKMIGSQQATVIVETTAQAKSALSTAKSGQIVYVAKRKKQMTMEVEVSWCASK